MLGLPRPEFSAIHTFDTCRAGVSGDLHQRLHQSRSEVERASALYERLARTGDLQHSANVFDMSQVSRSEMRSVYDDQMVRAGAAGRHIYNKLRIMSPNSLCPFCCQRDVSTLDHYLPKAHYSAVAVNPDNLVPCCAECNKHKGAATPAELAGGLIHPYFDELDAETWLHGEVLERTPATIKFSVSAPATWSDLFSRRVEKHFEKLRLSSLYRVHAVEEMAMIRRRLSKLAERNGAAAVRAHLYEEWDTRRDVNPNSWQAATYRALYTNDWYCEGGYVTE